MRNAYACVVLNPAKARARFDDNFCHQQTNKSNIPPGMGFSQTWRHVGGEPAFRFLTETDVVGLML